MSLLGKLLAVLNLLAAAGFLYLASASYSARQAWIYAAFRYDLALDGLPVDEAEKDENGDPMHLKVTPQLANELAGNDQVRTQEAALDRRRNEIFARLDDSSIPGTRQAKLAGVLLPLA